MSYWLFVTGYWCIFNQKLMGFLRAALQTTALYLRTSLRLGAFARDTGSGILPFPRVAPLIMSFFFAYILAPWRLCARHLYRLQKSVVAILFTYLWTSRKINNALCFVFLCASAPLRETPIFQLLPFPRAAPLIMPSCLRSS